MSQPRKLRLFNCDRTYKLEAVEGLLNATKAKLDGFDPVVEKHYFSLAQMSDVATNTIPKLEMDIAFFVVHAHESRLSINEENAGIGYANIYRALLERTEEKVIIIIGGDDNYESEDEEDRVVISRWARRKISSQFSEEFLDGRKSFIFSWNKKHREIHEEALRYYFGTSKEAGQKFEYQPKPTTTERTLSRKHQSMDEQRRIEGIGSSNSSSAEQRRQDFASSRSYSDGQTSKHSFSDRSNDAKPREEDNKFNHPSTGDQRRNGSLYSGSRHAEQSREDSLYSGSRHAEQRGDDRSLSNLGVHHEQRPLPTKTEDLAILCCNVSEVSLRAVMQVLQDIAPRLNLSANPPVDNNSPDNIKQYLTEAHLKFCVLVVDGETVKDAYENLPQLKKEYRELLETAANRVVEKVIILVCDNLSLPQKDEQIVSRTIEEILIQRRKGHFAWLKNGRLSVDPDVFVQCLMSTSPTPQPNPQINPLRASQDKNGDTPGSAAESFSTCSGQSQSDPLQGNPSDWEQGHWCNAPNMQQPTDRTQPCHPPALSISGEPVLLRSLLFNGRISYKPEDLQLWDPTLRVPDDINQNLFQRYRYTPVTGVRIVQDLDGKLQWSVDPKLIEISRSRYEGIEIANNETLMLKTRIREGQVSFQDTDVHFRYRNYRVPQDIIDKLKKKYCATPCGELCIISDEKGNLRTNVKIGKIDRFRTFLNKQGF